MYYNAREVTAVSWKQMMEYTARLGVAMTGKPLQNNFYYQIIGKILSCMVFPAKRLNLSAFAGSQQHVCDVLWFIN